ncbi:glycine betaine ABC transporter substrate-binding protein [Planosporangium thailandense]|uniref:Glycine betaine ABC transporter substrate-binding protein n=1 Tax=Planosporangium thailandense TaxID=765197 RepID=A0ABX0Y8D1_9ACTN|nr:glycine betaine ABC transporter substrate-binding protein [Planosporangium thailandense]NJC73662.1 glycine betaine ABC transporter substrate-binding protein [Planosporangium thailandense]
MRLSAASRATRAAVSGAATIAAVAALAACGNDSTQANQGSLGQELKGAKFTVGSKDFSESIILGQITMQLLSGHGATVIDKTNIKGSTNTRTALMSGDIDMYWEYTGTGWITYLKKTTPIPDPKQQYDAVAKEDLSANKVVWGAPAPLNNTYAFAIRKEKASELGVKTLSDLKQLVSSKPDQATFCIESEFSTRDDGWPGLQKAYGIDVPKNNVKLLDTGVIYTETKKGQTCNFGEVFATDGRIASLGLTVLDDDKKFFPVYNAALTLRQDTDQKYQDIRKIIDPVAAKLTNEVMQQLNAKVDADGQEPSKVAKDWLTSQGFLK